MPRASVSLLLAMVCVTSGCQLLGMNPGRLKAITVAAQVGEFKRVHGRWPVAAKDLDQSMLLAEIAELDVGDGRAREAARPSSHRIEMRAQGANLHVDIFDAANRRLCALDVLAPSAGKTRALIPVIVVKTTVFSCPGEGKRLR